MNLRLKEIRCCSILIVMMTIWINAKTEQSNSEATDKFMIKDFDDRLVELEENATSRNWARALSQFENCRLNNMTTRCSVQYTASQEQCQGKLSLNQLILNFFPNVKIDAVTNYFVIPEKFDCTKFYINTCKGLIEFQAEAREDVDLIPNRLRMAEATLILRIMYRAQSLYYAVLSFEMTGVVFLENRKVQISCSKSFDNLPISMNININQISFEEFTRLFSITDFTSVDLPAAVEELKTLTLSSVTVQGYYYNDGDFEFLLKGKPETSTVFATSTLYLVIQKPNHDQIVAGVAAYFQSVSFNETLAGIVGKDIFYQIPVLWYGKNNIALQTSATGIRKVKDEEFNRVFRFFVTRGMAISQGLSLNVEFPFQQFISANFQAIREKNLPLKMFLVGEIYKKRVSISFKTEMILSLTSVFRIMTSNAESSRLLQVFNDKESQCKINKIDLLLQTSEIRVYISVSNSFSIAKGLSRIFQFDLKLNKELHGSWKMVGQGMGNIANIDFQTEIKRLKSGEYSFLGKASKVSSTALMQTFAENSGVMEMFKQFAFLEFDIRSVLVESKMESNAIFRLMGKPAIFDINVSQYCELVLYNNTRIRPGFAFGIVLKNIIFDELLTKIFGERTQRQVWVKRIECAIMISSDNENKNIPFEFKELNSFVLRRGISISLMLRFEDGCRGDGLCELLKYKLDTQGSSYITLSGNLTTNQLSCEWLTDFIKISNNLVLRDVTFRIFGGKRIFFLMLATFRIVKYDLSLQGSISSDVASGLWINMKWNNQWKEPFGLQGCLVSELSFISSQSTLQSLQSFDLEGTVHIGTVQLARRIAGGALFSINVDDKQQSYFYSKVTSLELSSLLEAYAIHYQIPVVLQGARFIGAAIVSYSNNPLSIKIDDLNLKIENRLTIQGMVSIFGYLGKFFISVSNEKLNIEVRLPRLSFDGGFVKMISKCGCPDVQKFDGPSLLVDFGETKADVKFSGIVKCIGLSKETNVTIGDHGYHFSISGSMFGVFESDFYFIAAYGNPAGTHFTVKTCIPTALPNVTYEIVKLLNYVKDNTKELLHSTKSRVDELEMILKQSRKRMNIHRERADNFKAKIRDEISSLKKLQDHANPCLDECNNVCMGAPGWSIDALPFDRYYVGSPKWTHCAHEVPDIVCVVRCLGRSVIKNVKAFNKQKKLQKLVNVYEDSTDQEKISKNFLQKAIYRIGAIISKLESADQELGVGMTVARSTAGRKVSDLIRIDKVCMEGILRDAVESQITFNVKGKITDQDIDADIQATIDTRLWLTIASKMVEKIYPNATSFREKRNALEQVLSDVDKAKYSVLKELQDSVYKVDMERASKKDAVANDEHFFKQYAYMELPRYTLGNDRVVKLFTKNSPWALIQRNDPLEDAFMSNGTRRMLPDKGENDETAQASKKSSCTSISNSMKGFANILHVASGVAENFFEEKIAYLKSKNKQLAALRDIEDQIKSECYLENCTIGEMNDALKYAGKTKNGLIKWMEEVKSQLRKHDRASLQVATENIAAIVEKDKKMSLKKFVKSITEDLSNSYKRTISSNESQSQLSQLEQLDLDMRDLLLNSRGRRLTHTAPLIFSMKNRFKNLKRNLVNECLRKRTQLPKVMKTEE